MKSRCIFQGPLILEVRQTWAPTVAQLHYAAYESGQAPHFGFSLVMMLGQHFLPQWCAQHVVVPKWEFTVPIYLVTFVHLPWFCPFQFLTSYTSPPKLSNYTIVNIILNHKKGLCVKEYLIYVNIIFVNINGEAPRLHYYIKYKNFTQENCMKRTGSRSSPVVDTL